MIGRYSTYQSAGVLLARLYVYTCHKIHSRYVVSQAFLSLNTHTYTHTHTHRNRGRQGEKDREREREEEEEKERRRGRE